MRKDRNVAVAKARGFTRVSIAWRELYPNELPTTYDVVKALAEQLNAEAVAYIVSALSMVMEGHSARRHHDQQLAIARELFPPDVATRIELLMATTDGDTVIYKEQLLIASAFGLKYASLGPRGQWDSRVGAEFLLRILDFFESKTASQPADMLSLVLRRLGAMPNEQERYLVGRYFDLMVTRPRAKWGPPSPFDQAFREALSFSIEEYLALGYALVAGLIPIATVADLAASRFDQIVRVASSTIAHLPNAHEVERTLCAPVDWYRTETMDFPKDPNPGLTNLEPLYDKPLVRVPSGGVLPVSRSLLLQRLTLGIYWEVFTNKRLQAHGVVDVNAALGGLYQDYCTEALRAATAGRGVSQIIAESEVTGAPADSKPDLVVKEGRRWIVIETTVSTLKRRTLIQGDADAFRKEIAPKSHLGKKFRQPLAAATNLISGRTSCEDLPVGEVEEIVPVVLFLHPFPQHAVIRRELESAYQLPKVLRRPTGGADIKVLPLQLISTEEMEIMEPLLQKGGSLGALLLTRQDGDPFIAGGPLKNALMALPGWQEPDNPRMKELMDEMAVRCTPMLQSDRGEERNSPTDTP